MRLLRQFSVSLVCCCLASGETLVFETSFDNPAPLAKFKLRGNTGLDITKNHSGGQGGAMKIAKGATAFLSFSEQNVSGMVDLWVFEDGSAPSNPKGYAAGPMWGLMQKDGPFLTVGPIYARYLSGDRTYASSEFDPQKGQRPWQEVQYLGLKRKREWHRWTFEMDPVQGLKILYDGKDVNARRMMFNWNRTHSRGMTGLALFGDASDSNQTLWVDDIRITTRGPMKEEPRWPPPPPKDLVVPQPSPAHFSSDPYASWKNGFSKGPGYFPIAVWLQDPKNAPAFKKAGFNLFIGLWKGPTEEQLAGLKKAGMPVICNQNEVGLKHLDDPIIVGWIHGDEPDNAQRKKEGKGYGPPVPPGKIVANYEKIRSADPTRPVILNLGQGVAWDQWRGRGVRTNHPEDYPEYVKGCDIVSFDIYPVVHWHPEISGRLWKVPYGVTRLRKWTEDRKAIWNCIECTHISNAGAKASPQQVKAEVWMSLIFGSRGLIYFVHQFKPKFIEPALLHDPEMLEAVTAINQQIQSLAAVINSPSLPDAASVISSSERTPVRFSVKKYKGAVYLFAVSMYKEETDATFTLTAHRPAGPIEVLGENRQLQPVNGKFQDHFTGYAVHLYRVQDRNRQ